MPQSRRGLRPLAPEAWAHHVQYVLIDCDGTAVNSDEVIDRLIAKYMTKIIRAKGRQHFLHHPHDNCKRFHGFTFKQILPILAGENSLAFEADELTALDAEYERAKVAALAAETKPAPGVRAVLTRLRRRGKILAMVSSSSMASINACLQGAQLEEFFPLERRFSAAESMGYFSQKPDPDIYLYAMQKLGADPMICLAVEDSGSGIRSALAAGLRVIAYGGCESNKSARAHREKCMALNPIAYMEHWSQLLFYLELGRH